MVVLVLLLLATVPNIRIIGVADGTIIAVIITAHMRNMRPMSPVVQLTVMGIDIDRPEVISMPRMSQAK